ncbi:unnamed protein product [Didymodactylos carnosus]|uniref:Uncharacterized protein n=1 Tax=Didymodactylos carnosus TaxID=1234261 RepID=A0A8S2S0U2_9BILA|nr:unnamed protein product [Didymodactylos carnosus]CAF4190798.1 unnamed protein product [Didymodactylos carnosus]
MIDYDQRYLNSKYLQMNLLDSIDNSNIKDNSSNGYYTNSSSLTFSSFDNTPFKLEEEELYQNLEHTTTFTLCSDPDSEPLLSSSSISNILFENENTSKYPLKYSLSFTNNNENKIHENYLYPTRTVDDIMIVGIL